VNSSAIAWQITFRKIVLEATRQLARLRSGIGIRNRILRTNLVKRAQAEHTTVTNAAGAIFALIA